jgi:hypothetical protein
MKIRFHSGGPRIGSGAGAGIQCFRMVINDLDPAFHRSDDFLRSHQLYEDGFLGNFLSAASRANRNWDGGMSR